MCSNITVPEFYKVVDAFGACVTTNGAATGDWVSVKNASQVTIVVQLTQAVGHATLVTVQQASAVAGTGAKVLTNAAFVWSNEDVAATDTLVRGTDAKNYTVTADVKKKMIVFQIDPAICMDINNGFDCLNVITADSSQATNFVAGTYLLQAAYAKATPPSAILD